MKTLSADQNFWIKAQDRPLLMDAMNKSNQIVKTADAELPKPTGKPGHLSADPATDAKPCRSEKVGHATACAVMDARHYK